MRKLVNWLLADANPEDKESLPNFVWVACLLGLLAFVAYKGWLPIIIVFVFSAVMDAWDRYRNASELEQFMVWGVIGFFVLNYKLNVIIHLLRKDNKQ